MAIDATNPAPITGAPIGTTQSTPDAPPSLPEYGWAYFDHVRAEYDTFDDQTRACLPLQVKTILDSLPRSAPASSPHVLAIMGFGVLLWLVWGLWRLSREELEVMVWLASGAGMYLLWIVGSVLAPLYEKRSPCPTWGDLYVLEYWLVELLPLDRLRVKAWDWRDRYHQIAGDRRYQEYLKTQAYVEPAPPAPPPPDAEALLRADVKALVGELHRFYSLTAKLERKRTQLSQLSGACLGVLMFATLGVLAISFNKHKQNPNGPSKPFDTMRTKSTRPAPAVAPTAPTATKTPIAAPTALPTKPLPTKVPMVSGPDVAPERNVSADSMAPAIIWVQAPSAARPPAAQSTLSGQPGSRRTTTQMAIPGRSPSGPSPPKQQNANNGQAVGGTASTVGGKASSGSTQKAPDEKSKDGKSKPEPKKGGKESLPLEIPLLAMVVVMGTIGGFISMQRRLQSLSNESDPFVTLMGLERGGAVLVLLSTLSGAVFAVLLTLVFVGNFINGDLFPEFVVPLNDKVGVSFWTFLTTIQAVSGIDVAKMLVWAFIAGFAEQFVPDVLNRIVNTKPA